MLNKSPYQDITAVFDNFNALYGQSNKDIENRYINAFNSFKSAFGVDSAFVASSSGRVEVCGNHTDHNGGLVLSSAISLDTLCMFLPSEDNLIIIKSDKYEDVVVDLDNIEVKVDPTSQSLVKGVAYALKEKGYKIGGFIAYTTSQVSGGAGISSSAAFEVLIAEIFNFLYNDGAIDEQTKSYVSQFAENVFFGKPCGLLDQTAIAYGGLKMLDFSNPNEIKVTDVKNNVKDFTFVLINTGGSHANLTDEYASIPLEMKKVASVFGCDRLIEIGEKNFYDNLPKHFGELTDREVLRSVHFFEENNRVLNAVTSLENGNFESFCLAVNNSGISSMCNLQNCYVATDRTRLIPKALAIANGLLINGAVRVHGGGFAGCILCVVKNIELDKFLSSIVKFYSKENVIALRIREKGTIVL